MGVAAAFQLTLLAPSKDATVRSWSLPAWVVPTRSYSVMCAFGGGTTQGVTENRTTRSDDNILICLARWVLSIFTRLLSYFTGFVRAPPPDGDVIIKSRVAKSLNIQNNDTVDFLVSEIGETWRLPVSIRDDIPSDVLIHDLIGLRLAECVSMNLTREVIKFTSGAVVRALRQEMWASTKLVQKKGSAKLYFEGTCRNKGHGPCGYGYHIQRADDSSQDILVQGSGYSGMEKTSKEMEYEGLIEGIIWATRLDLERLMVFGVSERMIKQMNGDSTVKNPCLVSLHEKAQELLRTQNDLEVTFHHLPREENRIASSLANQAIATRMNVTTCNWPKINKLMKSSW